MSRMIISKKGSMPGVILLLSVVALIVSVWMFFTIPDGLDFDGDEAFMSILTFATPFLFLMMGAYGIGSSLRYSNAYINVYDDHIEGYGVLGKINNRGQNFSFDSRTRYTVSVEGTYVIVHCNNISYYIYLSQQDAAAVYSAVVNKSVPKTEMPKTAPKPDVKAAPNAAPEKPAPKAEEVKAESTSVICRCTNCGAQCRVPRGKGKIMIQCPKCNQRFGANT